MTLQERVNAIIKSSGHCCGCPGNPQAVREQLQEVIVEERKACATLANKMADGTDPYTAELIAAAILARSTS